MAYDILDTMFRETLIRDTLSCHPIDTLTMNRFVLVDLSCKVGFVKRMVAGPPPWSQ
jgi:hypothetical protein